MRWRRNLGVLLLLGLLLGLAAAEEDGSTTPGTTPGGDLRLVVEAGNRMYPGWHETLQVALDESFYIGDTPYQATIREFLPDFRITDGVVTSISQTLGNPAAHVFVHNDSAVVDSSWAFLNHPPHFSPRSFFSFKLIDVIGFEPETKPSGEE